MASYGIDPPRAMAIADELAVVTKRLDESLSTLQEKVELFKLANNGNAPDAYVGAQQLWNQGQTEMKVGLAVGRRRLEEIIYRYMRNDKQGAGLF